MEQIYWLEYHKEINDKVFFALTQMIFSAVFFSSCYLPFIDKFFPAQARLVTLIIINLVIFFAGKYWILIEQILWFIDNSRLIKMHELHNVPMGLLHFLQVLAFIWAARGHL